MNSTLQKTKGFRTIRGIKNGSDLLAKQTGSASLPVVEESKFVHEGSRRHIVFDKELCSIHRLEEFLINVFAFLLVAMLLNERLLFWQITQQYSFV